VRDEWDDLVSLSELASFANNDNPRQWGLPHDEFRPYQLDSIIWALSHGGAMFLEAPTGSGKTGIAAATSRVGNTIAVCRTKNLQKVNYGELYKAAVLYGKGNYPCKHPDNIGMTGTECLYLGESMDEACEHAWKCPYLIAKWEAIGAKFAALNYAYFLLTHWHIKDPPLNLFLDEAHQVPDLVLDFVGCTLFEDDLYHWDLSFPPDLNSTRGSGMLYSVPPVIDTVLPWLIEVKKDMRHIVIGLQDTIEDEDYNTPLNRRELVRAERLEDKVGRTIQSLQDGPEDWFIMGGGAARRMGTGKRRVPVLVCRPLTARHHLPLQFQAPGRTILMSATIGQPEVLAEELGIEKFVSRAVPNQWEPFQRPVHILDAPKLNYKSTDADFEQQADVIAEAIKGCDPNWCGLVHITRKREARLIAERLANRGLQDRIWVMPGADGIYVPTDKQVTAWEQRKRKVPNSICISWSLTEGYDGLAERINISAKVNFPALGDPYERARMQYSNKFYLQRTAYTLEQSLGRTRRGRAQDYDTQDEQRGFVAVADGNYMRVRKYLSESLREALVED
jgi:Rad3-related DNA helicase